MRTWLGAQRRRSLVFLVALGILLAGVPALANHGGVHGHCDANGNPVIEYGPPGWEQRLRAYCEDGDMKLEGKVPFDKGSGNTVIIPPDDFARWVNISLNRKNVRNPYSDVMPYIAKSSGRTVVPIRYLSEAFGAKVDWNAEKQEAVVVWQGRTIVVPVGKDSALVDGKQVHLDQPAILWNSRTMVPLRFLLEAVGATVEWDDVNDFVHLTLAGAQCGTDYCPQ